MSIKKVEDVHWSEWNQLIDDYIQTKAILIPRLLVHTKSKNEQSDKKTIWSYDFVTDDYKMWFFQITGKEKYKVDKPVPAIYYQLEPRLNMYVIKGFLVSQDGKNYIRNIKMIFSNETFSWNCIYDKESDRMKAMYEAGDRTNFNGEEIIDVFIDVPFGQVIDFCKDKFLKLDHIVSNFFIADWEKHVYMSKEFDKENFKKPET